MKTRQTVLDRIDSFLRRTAMSEREFGVRAAGDHKFVKRLCGGKGVTLTLIERVERYMEPSDPGRPQENALKERLRRREAHIGVIGLGYVGLPLVRAFGEKGFETPRRPPGAGGREPPHSPGARLAPALR